MREHRGEEIDLETIPLDDAKTFELLASGETTGIFQLESAGMRRYVRDLRPTSVYDLAAMVALYRPGPMDNIPAYIRRKHGQEPVTYLHPLLEPYLDKTYGIFVYQEDIMAAAIALGGFSGPEADTLGYAIRKKKSSVLRAQREKFVAQAAERGVDARVIDQVFAAFQPFERYGFNKAHATCYGLIAYQTAYLKANYTVEYMTAVLTAFRSNEEKVAAAIAECRRMGIEVLPPDVHRSDVEFTVEGDAIRFGLLAVKNVGQGAIESIIAARKNGGEFVSLRDFCERVDLRLVNSRVIEALAWVGALSPFGHPIQIVDALPSILPAAQETQQQRANGQMSAFELMFTDTRGGVPAACAGGSSGRAAAPREGAARPVSHRTPDGRGRGPGGRLCQGTQQRSQGRDARWAADRRRRNRDRQTHRHHEGQGHDGHRHHRGPAGLDRGRRLSRGCTSRRSGPGPTARSCSWPAGSTTAARRCPCWRIWCSTGSRPSPVGRRRSRARWPPASAARRGGAVPVPPPERPVGDRRTATASEPPSRSDDRSSPWVLAALRPKAPHPPNRRRPGCHR